MIVERLEVEHVRNVNAACDLIAGLNLFVGPNGAGKTAVLEAVHLLLRGRSFRTARIGAVIENGHDALSVFARCSDAARGEVRLGVRKSRGNDTALRMNGERVRQASAVAALLPVQLMLPNLSDLVFGGPSERRQWLDWGAFHVKPAYLDTLRDYGRALMQRNSALKSDDRRSLDAWSEQLAMIGVNLESMRRDYLQGVARDVAAALGVLAPEIEVELEYFPGFSAPSFEEALGQGIERDVKLGATQAGPHRADVRLRCGGGAAAEQLSRGQGKIVASAMRLGQARGLLSRQARASLFLIDDVGAELDDTHSRRFFGELEAMGCQILATSAHHSKAVFSGERCRTFHVKHGSISPA